MLGRVPLPVWERPKGQVSPLSIGRAAATPEEASSQRESDAAVGTLRTAGIKVDNGTLNEYDGSMPADGGSSGNHPRMAVEVNDSTSSTHRSAA